MQLRACIITHPRRLSVAAKYTRGRESHWLANRVEVDEKLARRVGQVPAGREIWKNLRQRQKLRRGADGLGWRAWP